MLDANGKLIYEDVHPRSVMELIDGEWSSAIRKACELEVDDNGVHVEDEDRITRMATYMMMVSVDRIKHDTDKVNLLLNTLTVARITGFAQLSRIFNFYLAGLLHRP